ncbi:hypothetical protein AB0J66_12645 [Actinoplanes sp. NPDC049598]|uniref:hypothetical protein n=1 Tax=Actinoplanes sp. NPDC049598 TaxID=3154626 RepID=UPI00341DE188
MTHELVVSIATGSRERSNRDAIGLRGWVLYASHNSLTVRLTLRAHHPVRVALAAGRETTDGHRDARLAVERLSAPDNEPVMSARQALTSFQEADRAIREQRETGRPGGCAAALLTVAVSGHAVAAAAGGVHVYRMVEGYAGRVTSGDGPGGLGGAERSDPGPPYEFRALPGDRLIMSTGRLSDADLDGAGDRSGHDQAGRLAFRSDGRPDLTVCVIDVVRTGPGDRTQAEAGRSAPADRPAVRGPWSAEERLPDVVR